MQIYLSKPGGEKEGPFTLEQVKELLLAQGDQGGDYWAWYEGLTDWVPVASVPGLKEAAVLNAPVTAACETPAFTSRQVLAFEPTYQTQVFTANTVTDATPSFQTQVFIATETTVPPPASQTAVVPNETPVPDDLRLPAGMPFSALEQIFILTTGEGQAASRSAVTTSLLEAVIGADWETIRKVVPRDAIAKCGVLKEMGKGPVPSMVWRAMTAFKPGVLQQAREGQFRICTRTFQIETGDVVSVFLFYNKQKLQ